MPFNIFTLSLNRHLHLPVLLLLQQSRCGQSSVICSCSGSEDRTSSPGALGEARNSSDNESGFIKN